MTIQEFTRAFRVLYDLHAKTFNESINTLYYKQFSKMSLINWNKAIELAVQNIPTFPKIPELRKLITECKLWGETSGPPKRYTFECKCRANISSHFVVLDAESQENIDTNKLYQCPNSFYSLCNKKYSAKDILQKGTPI